MSDDVIKNPARNTPKQYGHYEQEYRKLGRDPEIHDVSPFTFLPKGKPPLKIIEEEIPEQTHVFVGRNQNWFDTPETKKIKNVVAEIEQNVNESMEENIVVESSEDNKNPSIVDLKAGCYCLLLKGEVIADSADKDALLVYVEKILLENDPKFQDITVDDLAFIKRLPIKVGVMVVD